VNVQPRTATRLLLWGFQGTIDYRASLSEAEFEGLGLTAPAEDHEVFITQVQLASYVEKLKDLGCQVVQAPGGGPLLSALAADAWSTAQDRGLIARFVGAKPRGLAASLPEHGAAVCAYAEVDPRIGGTLALEFRPASSKLMLAVPSGRWLDSELAQIGRRTLWAAIEAEHPELLGLGIGGLNKANPAFAAEIIQLVRRRLRVSVVFVTGSSFARELMQERPRSFWSDLQRVFALANVISVSEAEYQQLSRAWGDDWTSRLLEGEAAEFVVIHSPHEVRVLRSCTAAAHLLDADAIIHAAQLAASRHAAKALTGAGAHFDGTLSAMALDAWET
jgi:hypothetical protein